MILIRVKPIEEGLALSKLFLYNCGKNNNYILRCILMDFSILHSRRLTLSLVTLRQHLLGMGGLRDVIWARTGERKAECFCLNLAKKIF